MPFGTHCAVVRGFLRCFFCWSIKPVPNRKVHIPSGDGIEQCLWHANEFRVTNSVNSVSPRRAGDDIKLSNGVSLTIFSYDGDAAVLLLSDSAKTTVDDNVETVAHVVRTP